VTHVLVVDNEAPIRLLCRVNLELSGMTVDEAADGESGLALARSLRPDVILLDLMMPGLDGWQVAEELQADERTRGIVIVVVSARGGLRERARAFGVGGVDFILKPFDPIALPERISRLLERLARGEGEAIRAERLDELRGLLEA
jgi:DNA-binding response OmpR family regulator